MTIGEKVSYIKGLAEGLKVDDSTNEGKILGAILDVLADISAELDNVDERFAEIDEELDDVAEVMTDIEESVADLEDEVFDYEDEDYEDDFDELDEMYETTCPNCGEDIFFDESILEDGGVECPDCGKKLEVDLEEQGGQCCGSCGSCAPPEEDGFEIEDSE